MDNRPKETSEGDGDDGEEMGDDMACHRSTDMAMLLSTPAPLKEQPTPVTSTGGADILSVWARVGLCRKVSRSLATSHTEQCTTGPN
jgi:hypothetical protein